ncbi:MAG TPA: hypothetical protein VFJ72_02360 [Rubrobacteraceae bacterium]|nr:hypothetical protein [Rubrobacteraceae bacterium]
MEEKRKLHQLEVQFQMDSVEILDMVLSNNRLHIAVKGAVAQEHLRKYLTELHREGVLDDFEQIDKDGQPDFKLTFEGHDYLLECKNVEKEKRPGGPMTVDFQRTRAPKEAPHLRYYHEDEFELLAACTFNRSGRWEFRFIRTAVLDRRMAPHNDRFLNRVYVDDSASYGKKWSSDLTSILRELSG